MLPRSSQQLALVAGHSLGFSSDVCHPVIGILARPAQALPLSLPLQHQPCLVAGLKLLCLVLHGMYGIGWFLSVTATTEGMSYTEELQNEASLLPSKGLYTTIY